MKVKEIPKSLYRQFRLRATPVKKLKNSSQPEAPLVVSLTSIPERIRSVDLVIRSLLKQRLLPEQIVLWLPESLQGHIPDSLKSLEHGRFRIAFSPLTCPHKKLIHSLEEFPGNPIVTCDDDLMYPPGWLEKLYRTHLEYPKDIVGHQIRYIRYAEDGTLLPYPQWVVPPDGGSNPKAFMAVGAGGVLYPPGSLDPRVQDRQLFLKLSPRADDLWFKVMGLLAGTRVRAALEASGEPVPILGSQKTSLKKTNINKDKNRVQWEQLTEYFGLHPL
ncbi:glycosyltransferase [Robiginitalea biformata]|uniref:Zn-dependent alcohol dehydrogenase, class III n=1 Tax=Robiginitalea biformata (strain ATCC BAA-864 / DSM 15991 / KCTC 12146 / HTCC2501) TaxID=313596 RepID=A4CMP9_ROBBH|nr:glycosyltransferase [Robiginitalea biformata]EAR14941.1 Zn-dependent alcohol dehydrogenase, class III [Robiginitalea biformata HTCC2501]